jgi:hypothetical protein
MRVVKQFNKDGIQITIFQWNGKIILKLEQQFLEITYKWSEIDVSGIDEVESLLDNNDFLQKNLLRFEEMRKELGMIGY